MAIATRPASRELRDAAIIFLMCFSGMAVGLAVDLQSVLPQTIGALCGAAHPLGDSIVLHMTLLPATNLLMLVGGLVAAGLIVSVEHDIAQPVPLSGYLLCSLAMLAGMLLCEWLGPQAARVAGFPWSLCAMTGAMTTGMAAGMAPRFIWRLSGLRLRACTINE